MRGAVVEESIFIPAPPSDAYSLPCDPERLTALESPGRAVDELSELPNGGRRVRSHPMLSSTDRLLGARPPGRVGDAVQAPLGHEAAAPHSCRHLGSEGRSGRALYGARAAGVSHGRHAELLREVAHRSEGQLGWNMCHWLGAARISSSNSAASCWVAAATSWRKRPPLARASDGRTTAW